MSATTLSRGRPTLSRFGTPAAHILLGAGPVVTYALMLLYQFHIHAVAVDFHSVYYGAAERLLHGGNPYTVSANDVAHARSFVYPALAAIVFVPFALLGRLPGELAYGCVCLASVPVALRALDVRDWRVYGIAMLWLPVYAGWQTANLSLPLMMLVALAWRYRDRPLVAGGLAAVAISLKPFVWPLALWLLATRRWRAGAWTVLLGMAINLAAWGVVGFGRVADFLRMSGRDTDVMWHAGYGVIAALNHFSVGRSGGELALLIASAIVAMLVLYAGLAGRDSQALALAVALMLVASPLVWTHYLALLLVPLALSRPRLSPVWAAPLALWVCPPTTGVHYWQLAVVWVVSALVLRAALSRSGSETPTASLSRSGSEPPTISLRAAGRSDRARMLD